MDRRLLCRAEAAPERLELLIVTAAAWPAPYSSVTPVTAAPGALPTEAFDQCIGPSHDASADGGATTRSHVRPTRESAAAASAAPVNDMMNTTVPATIPATR